MQELWSETLLFSCPNLATPSHLPIHTYIPMLAYTSPSLMAFSHWVRPDLRPLDLTWRLGVWASGNRDRGS